MQILSRVLVTSADSYLGYLVSLQLIQSGFNVTGIVSDPSHHLAKDLATHGVVLLQSDLWDSPALKQALLRADGVFFYDPTLTSFNDHDIQRHCELFNLILASRVSYTLYTSVGCGEHGAYFPSAKAHAKIEKHIQTIGLPHTVFRPSFFYSKFIHPPLLEMIHVGEIALPLSPKRKLQLLSEHDFAMLCSIAFSSFHRFLGKTIELASSERSMLDIAALMTTLTDHPVRYRQIGYAEFEGSASKSERQLFEWLETEGFHADISFLRKELGDPQSLTDYLRSINFPWFLSTAAGS
jgi:uncharacterized protein YbjT (DUF2867 family)